VSLGRRDAFLYLAAATLGSFGLGVAAFYLNFLYRSLGYDGIALGALVGAAALGVVLGAIPAATVARGRSRRTVILTGGVIAGVGLVGLVVLDAFVALFVAATLFGLGSILATSSGAALLADATAARARSSRFGQQIALGTMAAFFASALAGILAAPVASVLHADPNDTIVLRVLVAGGGLCAALSAIPVLFITAVPVVGATLDAPRRFRLLARFLCVEFVFGLGAGSFLPFSNLFFAERFGVPFAALGVLLGVIAVAGSLGALAHGRFLARRFGAVPSVVGVVFGSLPFAIVAAFAGDVSIAVAALAVRAWLMYGSSATWNAVTFSSFTPRERAGVNAIAALAWNAGSGSGAVISGAIRGALGSSGYTVNLLTLVVFYAAAAALILVFFRSHVPSGDVGAVVVPSPDSRA
jgi:predicted MFS family arabinose efflux permease